MAETIPPRSLSERYKKRPPEDDPEDEVEADAGLTPAVNTACFGTRIRSAHQRVYSGSAQNAPPTSQAIFRPAKYP